MKDPETEPDDKIEICMDPITEEDLNYMADQLFQMLDRDEAEAAATKALRQARKV